MGIEVQKRAIDIGIIAKDIDAMKTFYGEVLGLELEASIPMPGGGTMNRFKVGDSCESSGGGQNGIWNTSRVGVWIDLPENSLDGPPLLCPSLRCFGDY